ncbi:MAG: hypothetical protein M1820_007567 [Bogoriella megaspora]|nr:MAG: hypothetical protein M1820_007567 [Bogoriella megaspora]
MCGISCAVVLSHFSNQSFNLPKENIDSPVSAVTEQDLDESLEQIRHRGPDATGKWISSDKRIAFGHVRLAINDLSRDGEQPFHDEENEVHAVVNGELYDHESIRKELSTSTPYKFRGNSDCEIVIGLYKYHGLSFLEHLRGEFALCLYDSRNQLFIAARDRYGIKPLFWSVQQERLFVAAEMKAFLPLGWKPEWDIKSILDAGWNNDDRTLFQGVQNVRPGHYLTCQSFGRIEQRPYWDVEYQDKTIEDHRSEKEMIKGVRERLLEAVRLRLRADVPVGIYLSGGIDSSAIAGMVTHLVRELGEQMGNEKATDRVSCFSIAFDEDSGFNESSVAKRTADFLGVKYYEKHMNEEELAKRFEDATWHCEHHNPDLNFVGKFALSEVPLEHGFKVVLTGEGADEHFSGYPVFLPDFLREPDLSFPESAVPEAVRIPESEVAERDLANYYTSIGAHMATDKTTLPRHLLNQISTPSSMAAFRIDSLFAPWTFSAYGPSEPEVNIAHAVDGRVRSLIAEKWHTLHSAQYVWIKGHLTNIFLTCLGDRTEMSHSIEARTPFLDHKLTEYVNGLPPSVKIKWEAKEPMKHSKEQEHGDKARLDGRFVEKWILREAAKPFITKELYEREKHPYTAPTTYPENGPIHKLMSRLLTKEKVERLGFVDWEKIEGLVHEAFVDKKALAMRFAFCVAQWIILSEKFSVQKAAPFPVFA